MVKRALGVSGVVALIVFLGCAGQETAGVGGSAGSDSPGGSGAGGSAGSAGSPVTGGGPSSGGAGGAMNGGGGEGGAGGSTGTGVSLTDYPLETESNGSLSEANAVADGTLGFQGELNTASDVDVFSIEGTVGASLQARLSDGNGGCPDGADFTLTVYDPANLEIASASSGCPLLNGQSDLDLGSLATTGTYFVRVTANSAVPFYVLDLSVEAAECGDNVVQLGEECDDGDLVGGDGCEADCTITPVCGDGDIQSGEECDDNNTAANDGCDAACQLEGNFCSEGNVANDGTATATSLAGCAGGVAVIDPVGDQDYFSFEVGQAGSSLRAEVTTLAGGACPSGFDSFLRLYDSTGMELGSDDDDGIDACSLIRPQDAFAQNLAVGTYFLRVEEYLNDEPQSLYALRVNVSQPGCGDGVLQVGEACDDGNMVDGDACTNACTLFSCGAGETLRFYQASGLPLSIPDPGSVNSTITVPDMGLVKRLGVTISIQHELTSDLDISLDAPGAASIVLSDDNGFGEDYTGTTFSSSGVTGIASGSAPFSGVFAPEGSMASILNTTVNGAWVLTVADDAGSDTGSLLSYSISACVQ